jgi:hypothetical protein
MKKITLHLLLAVILFLPVVLASCSKKTDKVSPSMHLRSDGIYYCVRPDDNNIMMVIRFFDDGKLRASQWIRMAGSIGTIAEAKNAAESWLKQCEGFTICTPYQLGGADLKFDLNLANSASVFASGSPISRSFMGNMLKNGNLSCTWDYDDTRFLFNFISNSDLHPTAADSVTVS